MFKDALIKKLKELRMCGNNEFTVKCNKERIEFKLFEIGYISFLAYSGGGSALKTFFINENTNYEEIVKEVKYSLKGIDLEIENCRFI